MIVRENFGDGSIGETRIKSPGQQFRYDRGAGLLQVEVLLGRGTIEWSGGSKRSQPQLIEVDSATIRQLQLHLVIATLRHNPDGR